MEHDFSEKLSLLLLLTNNNQNLFNMLHLLIANAKCILKSKHLRPRLIFYGLLFVILNPQNIISTNASSPDDNPSHAHTDQDKNVRPDSGSPGKGELSPLQLYRKLFQQKRHIHMEAVKTILSLEHYEKQYEMVKLVLEKMFTVVTECKVFLMERGFSPGDSFPEEEKAKDALSKIAENTAFFGDILLRMPDITHDVLNRNKEWELAALWGLSFCSESLIFEGGDLKLLNLMGQELGVLDKDPDYVNPYRAEQTLKKDLDALLAEEMKQQQKKPEKKKKKKEKKRGPKLSHTEL